MRTPKQMLASHRQKITRIKRELTDMAAEWGEVDEYFRSILDESAYQIEQMKERLVTEND